MRIIIEYEASWRNSFLDGSNNEPLPKNGRNFVGSMTALKTEGNFKRYEVSKDTVMGVLNRLIGDQRKLYQARESENYYFAQLESKLLPEHIIDRPNKLVTSQEMIYLRNMSGNTDQGSFTGMIKSKDPAFNSQFSQQLWGVLWLSLDEVVDFILNPTMALPENLPDSYTPLMVIEQLEALNKYKSIDVDGNVENALNLLKGKFPDVDYKLTAKGQLTPISLYTSALYLQLESLSKQYDLSDIVSRSGGLTGISKRGFTKKDFMEKYTTGAKKLIWGNPFLLKVKKKGEGEVTSMLTKASGELEINLPLDKAEADDLKQKIENAGVSSFYLGKKGLAFVKEIR